MKHVLILACLLLVAGKSFSQDYMDKIVEKSCACTETVPDTLESQQFNMQLGLCMLEASMPYAKQIKKDHGIDMENINVAGEKLGRLIGMKMAGVCPDVLVKLTNKVKGKSAPSKKEITVDGTITKVEKDFFVVFTVRDESGKTSKYYWLTLIKSDTDLVSNYAALVGKNVAIIAESQDFFDPKLDEYRSFLIIKGITVVE